MALSRRNLLQIGAAGLVAPILPRTGWSSTSLDLNGMAISTLSDGNLTLPSDFITGPMPQDELKALQAANGVDPNAPYTPPCNVTLVQHEDRVILFDTGAGPAFQDSAGKLIEAMDAAGLDVGDVTHVVFTHAHPDHIWGLLDDFDEPLFYNAEHMIGQAEYDYWTDPDTIDTIGAERQSFAVGAARRLETVADALTFIGDGQEILPGVMAHATFGHSPGHMAFELRSGSEGVMVVGDALGNDLVAFARPEWNSGSDQDQDMAAQTRVRLLDQITADNMRLIGFHLTGGGIGHAEKIEGGYRYVAEA